MCEVFALMPKDKGSKDKKSCSNFIESKIHKVVEWLIELWQMTFTDLTISLDGQPNTLNWLPNKPLMLYIVLTTSGTITITKEIIHNDLMSLVLPCQSWACLIHPEDIHSLNTFYKNVGESSTYKEATITTEDSETNSIRSLNPSSSCALFVLFSMLGMGRSKAPIYIISLGRYVF